MSEAILVPAAGGEVIGDSPDRRVEILSDDDTVHATWSRFGPGRAGADLHIHRRHTDIFYVLEGELTVRLGLQDERVTVPAGRFAVVPPLVVHGFRNGSEAAEVRYLNFHAPGTGFADYMRGLRDSRQVPYDQEDPPLDGGRPASEATVLERVDVEAITIDVASGAQEVGASDGDVRSYYVLAGELVIAGRQAGEGTWLQVRRGLAHRVEVSGASRYLDIRSRVAAAR
jgi:mannose-6-phosphate isomerase-like protein (cupin superfamily)